MTFFSMRFLFLILVITLSASCVSTYQEKLSLIDDQQLQLKVNQLHQSLLQLSQYVDPSEAKIVAQQAVYFPLMLARDYQISSGPIMHNMLVNSGLKKRGLCIHWTEDLIRHLSKINLMTLKFYWGVANKEATFQLEHSSVVVTAAEGSFKDGLVLDPWRDSGQLYFSLVANDKYEWEKHYNHITAELSVK